MSCGNITPNKRLNKLILHKLDGRGLLIKVTMTLNCESESKEWCFKSHVKNSVLPSKKRFIIYLNCLHKLVKIYNSSNRYYTKQTKQNTHTKNKDANLKVVTVTTVIVFPSFFIFHNFLGNDAILSQVNNSYCLLSF